MLWDREPALIMGALQALLAAAVAFGWNLTEVQLASLLGAAAAVLAFVTRSQVTPS